MKVPGVLDTLYAKRSHDVQSDAGDAAPARDQLGSSESAGTSCTDLHHLGLSTADAPLSCSSRDQHPPHFLPSPRPHNLNFRRPNSGSRLTTKKRTSLPPLQLTDSHTHFGHNEVPQGRPRRHHHPWQVCRQEGTVGINFLPSLPTTRGSLRSEFRSGDGIRRWDAPAQLRGGMQGATDSICLGRELFGIGGPRLTECF